MDKTKIHSEIRNQYRKAANNPGWLRQVPLYVGLCFATVVVSTPLTCAILPQRLPVPRGLGRIAALHYRSPTSHQIR
jgi:hypothetical protein